MRQVQPSVFGTESSLSMGLWFFRNHERADMTIRLMTDGPLPKSRGWLWPRTEIALYRCSPRTRSRVALAPIVLKKSAAILGAGSAVRNGDIPSSRGRNRLPKEAL